MKLFFRSIKIWFLLVVFVSVAVLVWQMTHKLKGTVTASRDIWPGEKLTSQNTNFHWSFHVQENVEQVFLELRQDKTVLGGLMLKKGETLTTDNTTSRSRSVLQTLIPRKDCRYVDFKMNPKDLEFDQFRKLLGKEVSVAASASSGELSCIEGCHIIRVSAVNSNIEKGLFVMLEAPSLHVEKLLNFVDGVGNWKSIEWRFVEQE